MRTARFLIAALSVISLVLGCSEKERPIVIPWPPTQDTVTVVLQDGVSPGPSYFGTRDAILKDGPNYSYKNGNFGHVSLDTIGTVYLIDRFFENRLILRMDLSHITNCAKVIQAHLSISIEPNYPDSLAFEIYEVAIPPVFVGSWFEGVGGVGGGVSWNTIDGAVPWSEEGGDFRAIPFDEVTVRGDSVVTFALPDSVPTKWIRYPTENHGIIVRTWETTREGFTLVHLRESRCPELRPRFELTYLESG